jgi:hypothetical protein
VANGRGVQVKRDLDLIRKILLACEAELHDYAPHPLTVDGYGDDRIGFHVHLMIQAGLLDGGDVTHMGSASPMGMAQSMTWEGYEFLEAGRDEQRLNKATGAAKAVGGMTLDVLKSTLVGLATAAAKKMVGLP